MTATLALLRPYRLALLSVATALLLSLVFYPLGPRVPLGLFIAAVLVAAWTGGFRPAVVATALSTAALALLARFHTPEPEGDLYLRLGLFVLVGLLGGYLSQQCRRAIQAVDHVHDLLAGSGLAFVDADPQGQVRTLNPLACQLLGRTGADVVGQPLTEVFRLVHGPSRQPLPLPLTDVLANGDGHEIPEGALLVTPDGGEAGVTGSVGPVRDDDGQTTGLLVTFRPCDRASHALRELEQKAERFRALAGHAPTPLLVLDADGRCVWSNPAGQAACDCSAEQCLGEGWARYLAAADRGRVLAAWARAEAEKQPYADEFRLQPPRGPARWFRLRAAPMLSDGGDRLGQVAVLEDVSDRRRAEQAREEAELRHRETTGELEQTRAAVADARRDLAEADAARAKAKFENQATLDELEKELTARERIERDSQAALKAVEDEVERLRSRPVESEADRAARASLARELDDLRAARRSLEDELQTRTRERDEARASDDELRRLRDELRQRTEERNAARGFEPEVQGLREELRRRTHERDEARGLQAEVRRLRDELAQRTDERDAARRHEDEASRLRDEVRTREDELRRLSDELRQRTDERDGRQVEADALRAAHEERLADLRIELERMREELEAGRQLLRARGYSLSDEKDWLAFN